MTTEPAESVTPESDLVFRYHESVPQNLSIGEGYSKDVACHFAIIARG
jgi:hypothetical protein